MTTANLITSTGRPAFAVAIAAAARAAIAALSPVARALASPLAAYAERPPDPMPRMRWY